MPTFAPAFSPVRVLDAEGNLLRVVTRAELQARGIVVPEHYAPVLGPASDPYPSVRATTAKVGTSFTSRERRGRTPDCHPGRRHYARNLCRECYRALAQRRRVAA